jgi:hypothetical protein
VAALAVTRFGPSARGTATLNLPSPIAAGMPLTDTEAEGPATVPVTVVGLMFKKLRLAGDVMVAAVS